MKAAIRGGRFSVPHRFDWVSAYKIWIKLSIGTRIALDIIRQEFGKS